MDTEGWTLDELARRAGAALAADAVRPPNSRVRDRPDGRSIRWYATIGLVDRPLTGPGRSARYGPRHLLQVVAVKRLQAEGRSLAQIQERLSGATDSTLQRIARLPQDTDPVEPATEPISAPNAGGIEGSTVDATTAESAPGGAEGAPAEGSRRFWALRPTSPNGAPAEAAEPANQPRAMAATTATTDRGSDPQSASALACVRYEIALSPELRVTLPTRPGPDDLAALRAAAEPLLHLLAVRGLTPGQGARDEYQHPGD